MAARRMALQQRSVDLTPSWVGTGALPDIGFGAPRLGATYETIDVELPFTEGENTVAGGTLRYRPAGSAGPVRAGPIPLHPVRPASGADQTAYGTTLALYAPIVGHVEAGTAYEVRARVEDAAGRRAWAYLGTVTTREDAIPEAATLTPTHYVSTGGSDSNNGTSAGTPWKTLQKGAASTSTNGVCLVGPGFYLRPTSAIVASKTLRAEHPAYDHATRSEINVGMQAVVEGPYVTAPTGTADHAPGDADPSVGSDNPYVVAPWTAVQVEGTGETTTGGSVASPAAPAWYGTDDPSGNGTPNGTLWAWLPAGTPIQVNVSSNAEVGYGALRTDHPRMVGVVKRDTSVCATAGGFAEILFTNARYRYGTGAGAAWQDSDGTIYLALPSNARRADGQVSRDPNDFWIKFGDNEPGFEVSADDVRISGFAFHSIGWPLLINHARGRTIFDHDVVANALMGVRIGGGSRTTNDPTLYAHDPTIERSLFVNHNTWSADQVDDRPIPWHVVKAPIVLQNGATYDSAGGYTGANTRWISTTECTAVHGRGGGVRVVTRDNVIDGFWNGVSPMGVSPGESRYAGYGSATYRNTLRRIPDDAFEYDYRIINATGWDNDLEDCTVYMSVSPTDGGPILHFRDRIYRMGRRGVGRIDGTDPGLSAVLVKHSGGSDTRAVIHLYHLTCWAEDDGTGFVISGPTRVSSPFNAAEESIVLRNSIIRVTGYPVDRYARSDGAEQLDADYCLLVTTSPTTHGLRYRTGAVDGIYRTTTAWRAASGQGAHANVIGGATIDPTDYRAVDALLTDPTNGDVDVKASVRGRLVGVPIPGIGDAGSCVIGYQP